MEAASFEHHIYLIVREKKAGASPGDLNRAISLSRFRQHNTNLQTLALGEWEVKGHLSGQPSGLIEPRPVRVTMIATRLYRIFLRYAEANITLDLPGAVLCDATGEKYGHVSGITLHRNRIHIEGWVKADRLGLSLQGNRVWVIPLLRRPGSDQRGFAVDLPLQTGSITLTAERQGMPDAIQDLLGVSAFRLSLARIRKALHFLAALVILAPVIYRWKWQGDLGAREVVKEKLDLVPRAEAAAMETELLPDIHPAPPTDRPATLILPVYNAFELLREVLERIATHSGTGWRLLVIEDGSTDARVRPFLRDWCVGRATVTLLENHENIGFVRSVNRGFSEALAHWPEDPVVLVNSDAMVPAGWLPRLLAPLDEPDVASVTPMSNDAEIFSVPVICKRHDMAPGEADALDAVATTLLPSLSMAEAPTGVGFCMAIAPQYLALIPEFDTVFGRGYGEENDWCQKAAQHGGRHLAISNLFVEHRGGQSFGSVGKQRLLERNLQILSSRWPEYDARVQDFLRRDPMTTGRLALGIALAGLRQNRSGAASVPVYLAHALGGGAESYLMGEVQKRAKSGESSLIIRVGQGHRWRLELHGPYGSCHGMTNDLKLVERMVALLPARRVIYSCGVHDRDATELPDLLIRLAAGQKIEVLFHDYYPISPSYTLLGQDGAYHGVPVAGNILETDPAHIYERPGRISVPLADWQEAWGRLMRTAELITVFSESSREIIHAVWPDVADRVEVRPHVLPAPPPQITAVESNQPVIGVLGNIGTQKGVSLLQALSREMAKTKTARLVVLGQIDPSYRLHPPSVVHGNYQLRDLESLVTRYGITAWFMPSIWPETFSYTTHEMLATGLPVLGLDLGAQGEAIIKARDAGAPAGVLSIAEGWPDTGTLLRALKEAEQNPQKHSRQVVST